MFRRISLRKPVSNDVRSRGGEAEFDVTIDVYWCDAFGTQISGWAHRDGEPVCDLVISNRSGRAPAQMMSRPDLPDFFGGAVRMVEAGFTAYLAGPPDVELSFSGRLGKEPVHRVIPVPRHPLPVVPSAVDGRRWGDAIRDAVTMAPAGPVLALGVRTARADEDRRLRAIFSGREVIGVDIHSGIGVDVVADVHLLDQFFEVNSAAIVYSGSVLEHVAAPWLVARACAAVLVPGGLALHHAPWAWPSHAEPNDFWRMSPEGLRLLFSSALGFEVVETGAEIDVRMHVEPDSHDDLDARAGMLAFGTTFSAASSWIVARKVDSPSPAASWPYAGTETEQLATRYPVDGIAAPTL